MDAKKKTAGLLTAAVLLMPIVAMASPGTLAMIDIGLVGLLFVVRRRRLSGEARFRVAPVNPRALRTARPTTVERFVAAAG